jgi:hypothetical protein
MASPLPDQPDFSEVFSIILRLQGNIDIDRAGTWILGTWLFGGGADHDIVDDPFWTNYMMAHKDMARQISVRLELALAKILPLKKLGTFPIAERFHAEFPENNDFTGYALLHGSNRKVGDFFMTGIAEVQDAYDLAEGGYDIELDLRYRFNDIVDPNANYMSDRIKSTIAKLVSIFVRPRDYRLSINWGSSCRAEWRKGQRPFLTGYPSELHRALRPLPRAKLDWVGSEVKRAKDIEAKIISQLKRRISSGDIAALVDQKRKLLWLFYALTSFMSDDYLERLTADRPSDELVRLLHERISRQWRTEIIETLRGKRPQGAPLEWRQVT